jgi:hypothetical protein
VKFVPASLNFGNVNIFGGKSTKTTSLTNTGSTTLTIIQLFLSNEQLHEPGGWKVLHHRRHLCTQEEGIIRR